MPQLDMPLEELKKYKGLSPCPKDFDSYWEAALKSLDDFEWDVKIERKEMDVPFAECYNLTFTGVGGARIYSKYVKPTGDVKNIPAIINFHGYNWFSGDWSDSFKYVAAGFSWFAMDCRGQGGNSQDIIKLFGQTINGEIIRGLEDGKDSLGYRSIFLDCVQLARVVMELPEVDSNNVAVTGGSQGGALTLACASLEPRIKYAAAIHPFLSDYKRVWEMDMDVKAYDELRRYFRFYDPLHKKESEIFETLGYIDIKNMTNRIKAKTLVALTLMDDICPPSSQFAAYNNITSEKDSLIYLDYGHEFIPGLADKFYEFFMEMKK